MRVFNINKAIGLASSGVEYAQKYRSELLAEIDGVDDFYVFTDYMATNVGFFSDRLGFPRARVLWIYNLVAGRQTHPCTLTVDGFLAMLDQPHGDPQVFPDRTEVSMTGSAVRYRLRVLDGGIDRLEMFLGDQLLRVEHFDDTLGNVEHFHENRLVRRVFYAPDGRVAAQQFYRDTANGPEITRTVITPASPLYDRASDRRRGGRAGQSSFRGNAVLEGRSQFFQYVFARLFSHPDDVVIVDRALDVIDGIYPVLGDHRLYSVVHAEHVDLKQLDDGVLLWNNHYENVFERPELVDGFLLSTNRQKEALESQLAAHDPAHEFNVAHIPVGAIITDTAARTDYDRFAVVTASRLADEKHLDVLVRAVALARTTLPELHLDIYGEGNRDRLLAAISETQAQEYVRLRGHQKLAGRLGSYGVYASASWSEGFGLSLLEAMAEGLPVVGFDVDYGNRELVESGVNGRLVPLTTSDADVAALAAALVDVVTAPNLDELREQSLRKARGYTAPRVRALWERLLRDGVQRC